MVQNSKKYVSNIFQENNEELEQMLEFAKISNFLGRQNNWRGKGGKF